MAWLYCCDSSTAGVFKLIAGFTEMALERYASASIINEHGKIFCIHSRPVHALSQPLAVSQIGMSLKWRVKGCVCL